MPSRKAMTCCEDDIAKIGFMCHYTGAAKLETDSWVTVTVKVQMQKSRKHDGDFPVLYADHVEPAEPPEEEVVYFG